MGERYAGPRNPKEVRITARITEEIDARLERLADAAGQNKGTMAAFLIAASLADFEARFLGMRPEVMLETAKQLLAERQRELVIAIEARAREAERRADSVPT